MSVSYGGDSITFADNSVLSSGQTGFKNRIINGDMRVNQRGASVNVSSAGGHTYTSCDRYALINYFNTGWINTEQSTDVPANFVNSTKLTVGVAPPLSGTTGFYTALVQTIEGNNIADLYGSTVDLSFWVKSSITGTYSVTFQNAGPTALDSNSRLYIAEYTILQANTWEKKSITVNLAAGTASGTWNKTNDAGLSVLWNLGAESNRVGNTYLNAWGTMGSTPNLVSSSSTQWAKTTGATFFLTGVQLEKGSTESSFEYRPYTTELQLCQRYYQHRVPTWGTPRAGDNYCHSLAYFKVTMRANPSITLATNTYGQTPVSIQDQTADYFTTAVQITSASSFGATFNATAEL